MDIRITKKMEQALEEKIVKEIKDGYFLGVIRSVNSALETKLTDNGFPERLAQKVYEKLLLTEDDLVEGLSTGTAKEDLMKMVAAIMSETLKKIEEKIRSYGFIKIGN